MRFFRQRAESEHVAERAMRRPPEAIGKC